MNNKTPSILVVGDIILDHYLFGTCERISPEAPVPIVDFKNEDWVLGGAANVANNLIAIGANVTMSGIIGEDKNGVIIENLLHSKSIKNFLYKTSNRKTTTKTRVVSNSHQLLRIDKEDRFSISFEEQEKLINLIKSNIKNFDCVIISDYDKGLLTNNFIEKLIQLSNINNLKVFVDPKSPPYKKYYGAYLIKPNRKEAFLETAINVIDKATLIIAAKKIQEATSCEYIVITLSEDGVGLFSNQNSLILPTKAKEVFDVTGAGDTFIASLAYAITIGKSITEACDFANFAAGIVVGKQGCVSIGYNDIKSIL